MEKVPEMATPAFTCVSWSERKDTFPSESEFGGLRNASAALSLYKQEDVNLILRHPHKHVIYAHTFLRSTVEKAEKDRPLELAGHPV